MRVEYRVLGPLEVLADGEPVAVSAGRGQVLLATLLLRANTFVSVDELVERVWEGAPPDLDRARKTLHMVVARLRRSLGAANCVRTRRGGYLAEVGDEQLDLARFRALVERQEFEAALALWRGPVLGDVVSESLHRDDVPPLVEERLAALEKRIEADLDSGVSVELVPELQDLTRRHPLRDRFWAQLMLALYRSGQQAAALAAYRQVSEMLADELGIDPAPELRELHEQILRGEVSAPPEGRVVTPRQLPPDLTTFAGRAADLALLAASTAKVLVIAGTGGVGKTSLAVRWAHRIASRFPDGQLFLNLRGQDQVRPMSPEEALVLVLRGLGVESAPVGLDEQVAHYRSLVADRKFLLVLDNAATAEQVRPLLPASDGALTIVTSRGDLRGLALHDAELVRLPALTDDDGALLLERVLGEDRVRAERDAAAALVRLCGGLPLALRIAAADLSFLDGTTIADKVAQLGHDRLGELELPGDPGVAVRSVLDESYSSLREETRRVLRRLGVLPGADFTAHDAAAVAGAGLPGIRRQLDHLVGVHLVERRGTRFALHDLLRVYARERCTDDETGEALARLYDFHRRIANEAAELLFPDQRTYPLVATTTPLPEVGLKAANEAFAWLGAEHTNLLATAAVASERADHLVVEGIGAVLNAYYYEVRDDTNWMALCEIRDRSARASGDPALIAGSGLGTATYRFCQGDYAGVRQIGGEALEFGVRAGDDAIAASAYKCLGTVERIEGNLQASIEHHRLALAIHERTGTAEGRALALLGLAAAWCEVPDYPATEDALRQALALTSSPGLRLHLHDALISISLELGKLEQVTAHHEAYLALRDEIGSPPQVTIGMTSVARALLARGEADEAFDFVLDVLEQRRNRVGMEEESYVWPVLNEVLDHFGAHEDALAAAELLLKFSEVRSQQMTGHRMAARALRKLGELDRAAHHLEAIHALRIEGSSTALGETLSEHALLRLALGETDEALRLAEQAVVTHHDNHQRYLEAQALRTLAVVREAAGAGTGAEKAEAAAVELFRECGVPGHVAAGEPVRQPRGERCEAGV